MNENMQSLDYSELLNRVISHVTNQFSIAVRESTLEDYLVSIGFFLHGERFNSRGSRITNTILVVGESRSSQRILQNIADNSGLNKYNFEYLLDYMEIPRFNFNNLQHSTKYCAVLVGPMAHQQRGVDGFSSIIARMEEETDIYPPVVRITNSRGDLQISNSGFKEALAELEIILT